MLFTTTEGEEIMITQELYQEINKLDTAEEVKAIWYTLKQRSNRIANKALDNFFVGQTVTFTGRGGVIEKGTITKLNTKTAVVVVGKVKWTVSPNLLTKVN